MKIKYNALLRLCCYMSLAITFLPAVDYRCPWYITLIPVASALFVTLLTSRNIYPVFVAAFAIFGLWLLTWRVIYRSSSVVSNFINFFITFIPCILAIQLRRTVDGKKLFSGYLKVMAIFTGITCVTTIIGLEKYPMASRELASGTAIYDTSRYTRVNIGGYEFIYALVLLIPVFLWMIGNAKGFWKSVYTAVLVLDIWCIYASQYTIALVCVVVALLVVWMQKNRRAAGIFTVALVVFLLCGGLQLLGQVFYWASDVIGHEYVSDRLLQVAQLLSGRTVSTDTSTERIDHYMQQLEAFRTSPIWGHNLFEYHTDRVSGHSLVLDILGGAGLLGVAILAALVRKLYRLAVNPNKRKLSPHVKATWIMVIVVAVLNPVLFPVIITIVFMCCLCIGKLEEGRADESVVRHIGT